MSDLFDDGMGSFCEKVYFGLDLSILLFQNVSPCIRRTRNLRHADISILHGRLQLPAIRKSSVKGVQAHAILRDKVKTLENPSQQALNCIKLQYSQ